MAVEAAPVSPVPIPELTKITSDACDSALKDATEYEHSLVGAWNSQIIVSRIPFLVPFPPLSPEPPKHHPQGSHHCNRPLESTKPAPYRFTVNSTIVQQGIIDKTAAADGTQSNAGKRGMHSASGAFWDVNRDGMWTFKYPGAEERGLDVVVSVTWFAVN
ncbi:hypothetical protein POX_d05751 [Penicillium oxalicum]|uniref:hypothetical protein n=1 Tax=Penicillium oxalicum TaxID=69781 RepID=UPI0020B63802|nr:hypothetical protein POX_d05751 [Penicillium oxalicum]KAI2790244.1 hypothetical protein POX_d05751 [Penicillium oxalicum]